MKARLVDLGIISGAVIATGCLIRIGETFARAEASPLFYGSALTIVGMVACSFVAAWRLD